MFNLKSKKLNRMSMTTVNCSLSVLPIACKALDITDKLPVFCLLYMFSDLAALSFWWQRKGIDEVDDFDYVLGKHRRKYYKDTLHLEI